MILKELLSIFANVEWRSAGPSKVQKLVIDSRAVTFESVFVALRGQHVDRHQFLPEVCARGVLAVIVESKANIPASFLGAVVLVHDAREALEKLAAHFYHNPSKQLRVVGVTGTNGKTSVTYLIQKIFTDHGWPTAVIGTVNSSLTTPDPITLQTLLRQFVDQKRQMLAMEVSSHALSQRRADSVAFDVAIFTNLTRDHLDYHSDMDEYFLSKCRLFTELLPRSQKQKLCAVINTDDPWGKKLAAMVSLPILSYGSQTSDFQFQIKGMQFSATEFTLKTAKGEWTARVPLLGRHNVYNVTAAIAAASAMGVPAAEALQSLCTFSGVPGRMQSVPNSRGLYVYVDYAHTPDALEKVLLAVQDVRRENKTKNAIVAVFGCGGDRDRGKRTVMLQTALQCADRVVLTSDNPRSEDPQQIINDCLAGLREQVSEWKLIIEIERRAAIRRALSMAQPGDVIMIAGKGHENYQIVGNQRLPFSDFETAQEFLA